MRVYLYIFLILLVTEGCKLKNGAYGKKKVNEILGLEKARPIESTMTEAAVGGNAGLEINRFMDQMAEKIERKTSRCEVRRFSEGIRITIDTAYLKGKVFPNSDVKNDLKQIAEILDANEETILILETHCDTSGKERFNKLLSKKRTKYLIDLFDDLDVNEYRIIHRSPGENEPIIKNGQRIHTRRIEIGIIATKRMVREAHKGDAELQ